MDWQGLMALVRRLSGAPERPDTERLGEQADQTERLIRTASHSEWVLAEELREFNRLAEAIRDEQWRRGDPHRR